MAAKRVNFSKHNVVYFWSDTLLIDGETVQKAAFSKFIILIFQTFLKMANFPRPLNGFQPHFPRKRKMGWN